MSSVTTWLKGQRKTDLTELATESGLKNYESLKKADLEGVLEAHLRANETSLSKNPKFNAFYSRTSPGSPVKRERKNSASAADGDSKPAKPRGRRVTKATEELGTTDDSSPDGAARKLSALTRTPRANLAAARSVPLPPSPAVVADAIDRRTAVLRSKVSKRWDESSLPKRTENVRESLSSVVSIETLVVLVEAIGLRSEILPLRYAFTIPPLGLLATSAWPIALPDLFLLVTSSFWSPFTLWLTTSIAAPLFVAYFFNLTRKGRSSHSTRSHSGTAHDFDPLTFNIAKALVAFLVYAQDVKFGGLIGDESVERVRLAVPGGTEGLLIGAGIGALVSFYDAVLKK